MKTTLLSALVLTLLLSACSSNDSPVESTAPQSATDQFSADLARVDLTTTQSAYLDEMVYMEEDLSLLLDPVQENVLTSLLDGGRTGVDPRRGLDLAAIIYFNLIVKANPDLDEEILKKIRALIAESMQLRQRILQSGKSREEIAKLLEDAHNRLIRTINQLIGPEAIANVERLKRQMEEEREKKREEYQSLRIERQVEAMKKLLELTEEEVMQVRRILTYQHTELIKLRELYGANPERFREALRGLQQKIDDMMKGAIGEKWERWKQLQNKRIDPRDHESPIDMKVKELTRLLGLTERQATAIRDILTMQQEQMRSLMQQYGNDREKLAEALKALQERVNSRIASLLTPEQLEKWKRLQGGTGTRG